MLLPQLSSIHTQSESTYIAHNMFGQIKMEILWYKNRHTLISRKRSSKLHPSRRQLGLALVITVEAWKTNS
jgi:hypothetical protein